MATLMGEGFTIWDVPEAGRIAVCFCGDVHMPRFRDLGVFGVDKPRPLCSKCGYQPFDQEGGWHESIRYHHALQGFLGQLVSA